MHDILRPTDRIVVIVRPRQPFIDWINTSSKSGTPPFTADELREDCTALLVPEFEDETEIDEYLESIIERIFEFELENWHTDPALWPADRSAKTARDWLEFEMHSEVFDAVRRRSRAGRRR